MQRQKYGELVIDLTTMGEIASGDVITNKPLIEYLDSIRNTTTGDSFSVEELKVAKLLYLWIFDVNEGIPVKLKFDNVTDGHDSLIGTCINYNGALLKIGISINSDGLYVFSNLDTFTIINA